ncbi:MAG: hypothetical protein LC808_12710 [Actinobacteria bacterium]|nr:hypothetical protein [Actinomycetota bacterium]
MLIAVALLARWPAPALGAAHHRIGARGATAMEPGDRELLAELARINTDIPALGLRIMEGSASVAEQQHYAERLIAAGHQLKRRAAGATGVTIEGEFYVEGSAEPIVLPAHPAEPGELDWTP